jgi:hypothetical protein
VQGHTAALGDALGLAQISVGSGGIGEGVMEPCARAGAAGAISSITEVAEPSAQAVSSAASSGWRPRKCSAPAGS